MLDGNLAQAVANGQVLVDQLVQVAVAVSSETWTGRVWSAKKQSVNREGHGLVMRAGPELRPDRSSFCCS